jgi:hypothetical protein
VIDRAKSQKSSLPTEMPCQVAVGIAALGAVFQGRTESRLGDLLANGPPALQGHAGELAPAVASGNADAAIAAAPPEAQAFLADAAREAFLSGLNEIFMIGGVTALVGVSPTANQGEAWRVRHNGSTRAQGLGVRPRAGEPRQSVDTPVTIRGPTTRGERVPGLWARAHALARRDQGLAA